MCLKEHWHCKTVSILGRLAGGRGRQELDGRCCGMDVGNGGQGWTHMVKCWFDGVDVEGDTLGVHNLWWVLSSLVARCCSDGSL